MFSQIFERVNNYLLALFCAKFSCISAIRYHVFRWELYKDCVWKSVKNSSVWAFREVLTTGYSEWLATGDSPKCHTCEACRKLKGHDSWSTTGQKRTIWPSSYLATHPNSKSPKHPVLQKNVSSHSSRTLL